MCVQTQMEDGNEARAVKRLHPWIGQSPELIAGKQHKMLRAPRLPFRLLHREANRRAWPHLLQRAANHL